MSGAGRQGECGPQAKRQSADDLVAVGYRFEIPGTWSEPAENLDDKRSNYGPESELPSVEMNAQFTDISGKSCGSYRIRFLKIATSKSDTQRYAIDNADVNGLLKVIASCAVRPIGRP